MPSAEPVYYQNGQNGHAPQPVVQAAVAAAPAPAPVQVPAPAPVAEVAPQPVSSAPLPVQAPAPQPTTQPEPQLFQRDSRAAAEPDLFFMDAPAPVQNVAAATAPVPVVVSQPQQAPHPEPSKSSFIIADDTPEAGEVEAQVSEPQNTHPAPIEVPAEENEAVLRAEEQLYHQQPQVTVEPSAPAPAPAKSSIFSIIEDEEDEGTSPPRAIRRIPAVTGLTNTPTLLHHVLRPLLQPLPPRWSQPLPSRRQCRGRLASPARTSSRALLI
ncbi:hypothetical protein [Verrucomicrobium spinosum]|uniref:hypothetical protein n=1 Tax=Verrucomicrobium spinosum TaxID=2736 RepID=UPI0009465BD0|nr:hypothetical protein [Verrucomicrobium spinosum]